MAFALSILFNILFFVFVATLEPTEQPLSYQISEFHVCLRNPSW